MRTIASRRGLAAALAWLWLSSTVMPAVGGSHALDVEDPAFARLSGAVHHPGVQVEPVLPAAGDGHCDICHLQRTLSSAAAAASGRIAPPARRAASFRSSSVSPPSATQSARAPRGPPAGL